MPDPVSPLLDWLKQRHQTQKEYERKAYAALYNENNEAAYRTLMVERAELIAALDEEAADLVAALPEDKREAVAESLRRFAKGASNALRLESVFYMSALLYPDEHSQGEPDNLELLIARLES